MQTMSYISLTYFDNNISSASLKLLKVFLTKLLPLICTRNKKSLNFIEDTKYNNIIIIINHMTIFKKIGLFNIEA